MSDPLDQGLQAVCEPSEVDAGSPLFFDRVSKAGAHLTLYVVLERHREELPLLGFVIFL